MVFNDSSAWICQVQVSPSWSPPTFLSTHASRGCLTQFQWYRLNAALFCMLALVCMLHPLYHQISWNMGHTLKLRAFPGSDGKGDCLQCKRPSSILARRSLQTEWLPPSIFSRRNSMNRGAGELCSYKHKKTDMIKQHSLTHLTRALPLYVIIDYWIFPVTIMPPMVL